MDVLPLQFRTLHYIGLWYEPSEHQHWLVKYIWKPFVISALVVFTMSQLAAMKVYRDNISEFTECLFMSLTWFIFCLKLFNFLWRIDDMNEMLHGFRESIFIPRTDDERRILSGYLNVLWIIFVIFSVIVHSTAVAFELLPLISILVFGSDQLQLPYKSYEFYNHENLIFYSLAYIFQVGSIAIGVTVDVVLDTLLSGFVLLICAQIDICRHRFILMTSAGNYTKATRQCATHQQLIRHLIRKMQSYFMCVVVPQLFFSLITLCTSLYNMTRMKLVESLCIVMYLACLQCQIFFYCWFGNELKLKTSTICDTIFQSDWTAFSQSDRKTLYFILLVCQKDMSISFHGFCPVTLEIYIWVLKTSYAAFNLLKTVEARN